MRDITHTDLELLYQLADGIDGEDADPGLSLIHISEPTRLYPKSRMPSSA